MEIATNNESSNLLQRSSTNSNRKWSTLQLILLSTLLAIIAGLATNLDRIIGSMKSSNGGSDDSSLTKYDVVVIGMGATGLTTTEFLSNSYPDLNILIIEKLSRIGGRTFSNSLKYKNKSIIFENGAMRFPYHPLMFKMLNYLNLCDDFILMDNANIINTDNANYLFRNKLSKLTNINITNYWKQMYHFTDREWDFFKNNTDLIEAGYNQILNENNNGIEPQTDDEWYLFRTNYTLDGIKLYNWNWWAFSKIILNESVEYTNYRIDTGGARLLSSNNNDRNMAMYLYGIYGPKNYSFPTTQTGENITSNTRWTLKNGYNSITWKLFDNIQQKTNIDTKLRAELIGIDYNDDAEYKYKLKLKMNGSIITDNIITKNVILTVPPAILRESLSRYKPIDTEYVYNLIRSVYNYCGYKINLIFDSMWWMDVNLTSFVYGSSTSLEINQIIMDNSWINDTLIAIQIYTGSDLWHNLQSLNDPYEINADVIINDNMNNYYVNNDDLIISSKYVVNEAIKQMKEWFNLSFVPMPIAAFSQPLGQNLTNMASDDNWKYGYNVDYVLENIFKPIKNESIFIASSSYSKYHSWQFGAVWAAINNLKQNFDATDPMQFIQECNL